MGNLLDSLRAVFEPESTLKTFLLWRKKRKSNKIILLFTSGTHPILLSGEQARADALWKFPCHFCWGENH